MQEYRKNAKLNVIIQLMQKCKKNENSEKKSSCVKTIDKKMWERIQGLRLLDDDFMTIVFSARLPRLSASPHIFPFRGVSVAPLLDVLIQCQYVNVLSPLSGASVRAAAGLPGHPPRTGLRSRRYAIRNSRSISALFHRFCRRWTSAANSPWNSRPSRFSNVTSTSSPRDP